MPHYCSLLVLAAALLTGCADATRTAPAVPHSPPRTEADAGVIVTNLARQMGVKLEAYQQPKVRFDAARREWSFFYMLKPPGMPGGHFTVIVDETGKTQFIGGA